MPRPMDRTPLETRTDSRPAFRPGPAPSAAPPVSPAPPSRFTGRRVHFIGIGGSGMSGLAGILLDLGAIVTGSETRPSSATRDLARRGASISYDQVGELLSADVDLVVRTAAIPEANPEYQAALALGLRQTKYAQVVGELMRERDGVAVAGTHGKSTTTSMIAFALRGCGRDPGFVVGGTVPQLRGGSHAGADRAFVAEACEFNRSFHHLSPRVAVITNIEADHLDCYKDLDDIVDSFRTFAARVPAADEGGVVIANGRDADVRRAVAGLPARIEWVAVGWDEPEAGAPAAFHWYTQITGARSGGYEGQLFHEGRAVGRMRLQVAGEHNLFDATAAVAACVACGADPAAAAEAVGKFTGVDRRMTEVGLCNGAVVVDDYGHHPTEIRATLKALRERYTPRRLLCVFQPHQHSRTRFLLDDFAQSFGDADETIVPDIFYCRDSEDERSRVHAEDLVRRISGNGRPARHLPAFGAIAQYLKGQVGLGDVVVTMGAGNIWEVGRDLVA